MSDNVEDFDYDVNSLTTSINEAPEAGFVNINFGRLTIIPGIGTWGKKDAEGKSHKDFRPMAKGEQANEIKFIVDIQEFNPELQFKYERNVALRVTSDRAQSDWSEIVLPALTTVLGPNWPVAAKSHPYVAVEDTPTVEGRKSKTTGKPLGVPRLVAVYKSEAECRKAREDRFGGANKNGEVEAEIVEEVRTLLNAVSGDQEQLLALLKSPRFAAYDPKQLITLASI